MKDHDLHKPIDCIGCGQEMTGAFNTANNDWPEAGNTAICIVCRSIMVFDGEPVVDRLRHPTDEELKVIMSTPSIVRVITALGELHRQAGPIT